MVRRLRETFATNPMLGDAVLMLAMSPLTFLATVSILTMDHGFELALLMGVAFTLPLLWRRTRPELASAALVVPHLAQVALVDTGLPANFVAPVALYAAVRHGRAEHSRWWLGVGVLGSFLGGVRWGLTGNAYIEQTLSHMVASTLAWTVFNLAVMVAVWFSAQWARQREENLVSLQQRAEALERERDKALALVAEEERSRIAREMHDIVAHSLSVIVVQSDGAGYLAAHDEIGDPAARLAQVSKAIETINATAREALGETRRLVGVLRHGPDPAELAPAATLDQIADLVERLQSSGMSATFTSSGHPQSHPPLSSSAEMAAYRVVQESLTNVMKHAGPGANVSVVLTHTPRGVDLHICDDGRGATPTDGQGHGVIGMRERMTAFGGSLVARPRLGGGFEVIAHLPADSAAQRPTVLPPPAGYEPTLPLPTAGTEPTVPLPPPRDETTIPLFERTMK